ncbi:UAA transporter [Clavulina sp. PMI_390]|nr:UAA transporter [Clavulina sp. PMI_390]
MQPIDVEEYTSIALRVYGGCCTNAFTLESLMSRNSTLGSTLTFLQLVYVTGLSLPSFIVFDTQRFPPRISLKARAVPLRWWLGCVILSTTVSLLNNWAFAYHIPVSLQIVIRSAGLAVAMCIGYLFMRKRYTSTQVFAAFVVTAGVILATYSRPSVKRAFQAVAVKSPSNTTEILPAQVAVVDQEDASLYLLGVGYLALSVVLSGVYGALQERIFTTHGPHWRESVFYTNGLGIPFFLALGLLPEVQVGVQKTFLPVYTEAEGMYTPAAQALMVLAINLLTQDMCVKSVNRLTTRVSSVSTNLVLTGRKAASVCISVWWFDSNGWNHGMTVGAGLVFCGTILYGLEKPSKSSAAGMGPASSLEAGVIVKPNDGTAEPHAIPLEAVGKGVVSEHEKVK